MANIDKLVDQLSELTVLEAAELAKALEDNWGVSAAAAVAAAPRARLGSTEGAGSPASLRTRKTGPGFSRAGFSLVPERRPRPALDRRAKIVIGAPSRRLAGATVRDSWWGSSL